MSNNIDINELEKAEIKKEDSILKKLTNSKQISKILYSLGVACVATLLITADFLVAPLLVQNRASFAWIAFINWTLFATSSKMDRFRALVGYIIGYLSANFMIWFGSNFELFTGLHSTILPIGSLVATFFVNALIAQFGSHSAKIFSSVPATFIGLSLAFSGLGIGMNPSSPTALAIIMVYGVIGLLCCFGCDLLSKKILKE